jgi:hypothetical protein
MKVQITKKLLNNSTPLGYCTLNPGWKTHTHTHTRCVVELWHWRELGRKERVGGWVAVKNSPWMELKRWDWVLSTESAKGMGTSGCWFTVACDSGWWAPARRALILIRPAPFRLYRLHCHTQCVDIGVWRVKIVKQWRDTFWPQRYFSNKSELQGSLAQVSPHGSGRTPRKGRRQQPHQTLKKCKEYKGGKKSHMMVAQSSPKMLKWHHFTLKAWSILAWILESQVDRRELMAFQVAIPTSTVATQACWRIFLEEYWLSKCFRHLSDQRK